MQWQAPTFEEVNMSAEIGAYQGDGADDDHRAPEDEEETAEEE